MATLRNTAISLLLLTGPAASLPRCDIMAATAAA